jgi:hypothetical protein
MDQIARKRNVWSAWRDFRAAARHAVDPWVDVLIEGPGESLIEVVQLIGHPGHASSKGRHYSPWGAMEMKATTMYRFRAGRALCHREAYGLTVVQRRRDDRTRMVRENWWMF